jgi:hypothetical protein
VTQPQIPAELFKQALDTCTDACEADGQCNHHDAIKGNDKVIQQALMDAFVQCVMNNASPSFGIFDLGVHVGYRLHQLETDTTPTPKDKVN